MPKTSSSTPTIMTAMPRDRQRDVVVEDAIDVEVLQSWPYGSPWSGNFIAK